MSWPFVGANDDFILGCLRSGKYAVDEDGHIWNLHFRGTGIKRRLAETHHPSGYRFCELSHGDETHCTAVHRVVLLAKTGPAHFFPADVNHKNGRKADNRPRNLEWVTPSQNVKHAYSSGLKRANPRRGELHPFAKLTDSDVSQIFMLRERGLLQKEIGARLGVCQSHVSAILRGARRRARSQQ
jgi:hypothetical protein